MDDTQQVSLSSKFRKYFKWAVLFLVLISYTEGNNWKIWVPRSCTCTAVRAVLAHSPVDLAGRNAPTGKTPLVHQEILSAPCALLLSVCRDTFPLCLFSLAGLHLFRLSLQECQQGNTRETRQEPSRSASSTSTRRAEGLGASCPQQEMWCPGNGLGFNVLFRLCILDKCKHNPGPRANLHCMEQHWAGCYCIHGLRLWIQPWPNHCKQTIWVRKVLRIRTSPNGPMTQGHRYLCAEFNRWRRQKGARLEEWQPRGKQPGLPWDQGNRVGPAAGSMHTPLPCASRAAGGCGWATCTW